MPRSFVPAGKGSPKFTFRSPMPLIGIMSSWSLIESGVLLPSAYWAGIATCGPGHFYPKWRAVRWRDWIIGGHLASFVLCSQELSPQLRAMRLHP